MPRLPLASREDLEAELAEIRADLDSIVGEVCPERAEERRVVLRWWERDLQEQLAEMDAVGA